MNKIRFPLVTFPAQALLLVLVFASCIFDGGKKSSSPSSTSNPDGTPTATGPYVGKKFGAAHHISEYRTKELHVDFWPDGHVETRVVILDSFSGDWISGQAQSENFQADGGVLKITKVFKRNLISPTQTSKADKWRATDDINCSFTAATAENVTLGCFDG